MGRHGVVKLRAHDIHSSADDAGGWSHLQARLFLVSAIQL